MEHKLLSTIGLCRKAGKLLIGAENAAELIKSGRAELVAVAADAAENTVRKLGWMTEGTDLILMLSCSKTELARVTGQQRDVAVVSTADKNFAKVIKARAKTE